MLLSLEERARRHHEVAVKVCDDFSDEEVSPGEKLIVVGIQELGATVALAADKLTRLLGVAISLHFGDGTNQVIDRILDPIDDGERG